MEETPSCLLFMKKNHYYFLVNSWVSCIESLWFCQNWEQEQRRVLNNFGGACSWFLWIKIRSTEYNGPSFFSFSFRLNLLQALRKGQQMLLLQPPQQLALRVEVSEKSRFEFLFFLIWWSPASSFVHHSFNIVHLDHWSTKWCCYVQCLEVV